MKVTKIEPDLPKIPERKRVAAYARVSMDSEELINSLENQVLYYTRYIQNNPDWIFVKVYVDKAISGKGMRQRTAFREMIETCKNGEIDIILVKSISRFSRNTVDLLSVVRYLTELGVEIRFEKEGINTMTSDGELMLSLLGSFAQAERSSIAQNVEWAKRKQFEQGIPANNVLYGYKRINGRFEIVEEQAEVVRLIFDMFLEGNSTRQIARFLNENGYQSFTGGQFEHNRIHCMLQQEKYTGNSLCQKSVCSDNVLSGRIQNTGQAPQFYLENTHDAIISQEKFDAVQEIISSMRNLRMEYFNTADTEPFVTSGTKGGLIAFKDTKELLREHATAYWSVERRQAQSEFLKLRESRRSHASPFSLFLKCEGCGYNFGTYVLTHNDGTETRRWYCYHHNKVRPDLPNPVGLNETVVEDMVCGVLGLKTFDPDIMHETLSYIGVNVDMLTFYFKDGRAPQLKYICKRYYHEPDRETRDRERIKNWRKRIRTELFSVRAGSLEQDNPFSLFIQCERCGAPLTKNFTKYRDGRAILHWCCRSNHGKDENTPVTPRLKDPILREMVCEVLGIQEFDEETLFLKIAYISQLYDVLTFHFNDGTTVQRKYELQRKFRARKVDVINARKKNNNDTGES